MRIPPRLASLLSGTAATAAVAALASCSGGSGSAMPQGAVAQQQAERTISFPSIGRRPPSVSRVTPAVVYPDLGPEYIAPDFDVTKKGAVFLTDYSAGTLTVFSTSGTIKETLKKDLSFPEGITGDSKGNIYLANAGSSTIRVYAAPKGKHLQFTGKISDPGYFPSDVSLEKKTGIIGVTNIESTSGGPGSVRFFSKHGAPCGTTITDPNWAAMYFGAFDADGNLYVDGFDAKGSPIVGVVTGDCQAKKITTLGGAKLAFPGGIQVAGRRILIDDQGSGSGSTIYTYALPVKNTFGKPLNKTPLQSGNAVSISLNHSKENVFEADSVALDAQMFDYPAGGSPDFQFTPKRAQLPVGVYVSPPVVP